MRTLLLDLITCSWRSDVPPSNVSDQLVGLTAIEASRRLKQLCRNGQPDEICAITYRLIDMDKPIDEFDEPKIIFVKTKHAELSDETIEKLDCTRDEYESKAISLQDASIELKEVFTHIDQNPVFSSWGHYPIDRLQREFARSRSKSVFGSRIINIKLVMSFMTVGVGKELSLKEAVDIVWSDLNIDKPRNRTAIDDLNAMSEIAWWCLHRQWHEYD